MSVLRKLRPLAVAPEADEDGDPLGALLRRAGRGDAEAFSALYDELAPFVHRP